jgi:hypothetical protein
MRSRTYVRGVCATANDGSHVSNFKSSKKLRQGAAKRAAAAFRGRPGAANVGAPKELHFELQKELRFATRRQKFDKKIQVFSEKLQLFNKK